MTPVRLYDESGAREVGRSEVPNAPYVLVMGQPGLGPIRVFVYDGPVFLNQVLAGQQRSYQRYREATVGFVKLEGR